MTDSIHSRNTPAPTILLGVTGCIAAYKSCELIRAFQKRGFHVKVVMTEHATHFVSPLTFRSLTHDTVSYEMFDNPTDPIHHISLAQEADAFLIAPCTANVIAKIAHGIADDLLSTTALATTVPLVIAPAMNVHMFENHATQDNLQCLSRRGIRIISPDVGYLACGESGKGRLADLDVIVESTLQALSAKQDMAGLNVLITAGPTEEPIDPVRCLTNHSSGKTGYALAAAAHQRGAEVTLISGPVTLTPPDGVRLVPVTTACEMADAASDAFSNADVSIFAAAVADVRPKYVAGDKLKKGINDEQMQAIELVRNPDILSTLAHAKQSNQTVIGFAAETQNVLDHAREKLVSKGAHMIVANQVGQGRAFGTDANEVWLVTSDSEDHIPSMSKRKLADVILDKSLELRA